MIIKEFLPNPAISDKEGEYIKILNDSAVSVDLNGWQIKDAAGKTYKLSGNLAAGQELLLPYSQTKISLNNAGEKLFLYDSAGKLVDELGYSGQASEGQIINKSQQLTIDQKTSDKMTTDIFTSTNDLMTNNSITRDIIFIDFLIAVILAGLGLYIILELEKKLEIKLW